MDKIWYCICGNINLAGKDICDCGLVQSDGQIGEANAREE